MLLGWLVQRGIAVIPKTLSSNRMVENSDLFSFTLDEQDYADIRALNANIRFNDPAVFADYPIYD